MNGHWRVVPSHHASRTAGGSQQRLLAQITANLLGVPVLAGPVEATAIGNILMQAHAVGAVGAAGGPSEIQRIVASSTPPRVCRPRTG
jgi:rhamnulokinase